MKLFQRSHEYVQIKETKVAHFTSYQSTRKHNFGNNKTLSCKNKIQLKNFVLKGNFKLLFFLKFPEGVVCIRLKTIWIGSPLLTLRFKSTWFKRNCERVHSIVLEQCWDTVGGEYVSFLLKHPAQCLVPRRHSVAINQLSDDSIFPMLVTGHFYSH